MERLSQYIALLLYITDKTYAFSFICLQEGDRLSSSQRTQRLHVMVTLGSSERRRPRCLPPSSSHTVTLSSAQRRRAPLQSPSGLNVNRPTCVGLGLSTLLSSIQSSSVPLADSSGISGFVALAEPLVESVVNAYPCRLLRENRPLAAVSRLPHCRPLPTVLPHPGLARRNHRHDPAVSIAPVRQPAAGNVVAFNTTTEVNQEDLCGP